MATQTYASLPIGVFTRKLKGVFFTEAKTVPDYVPKIYNVSKTDIIENKYQGFNGLPNGEEWDGESTIDYSVPTTGYETTMLQKFFRMGTSISWKNKTYDTIHRVGTMRVKSLARAMARTRQVYTHSFLNQQLAGTGTKWNTTENQYLFATHTLANGSTFANLLTGALSVTKLQEAIYTLEQTPDENGTVMGLKAKTLIVNPYLEFTALEILNRGVGRRADTANNTRNAIDDWNITLVVDEYCTDTNGWMLRADEVFTICEESMGYTQDQWEDKATHSLIHDAIFALQVGATDWRGWVGSRG